MNTFGLGLTITFDDQASEGIARVTQSYLGLEGTITDSSGQLGNAISSEVGLNLSQVGDSLIGLGSKVTNIFKKLVGNVKSTGQEFENFKITLGAVYKDESIVDKKLQQLFDFSVKSPFEVSDTKDMLLVLQSQGIDAFEKLTSASTGFAQEGLSWITDLMSFKPDVPVERWKLALTNFLGSGDAKTLRNILDAGDISDIIGRSIADTSAGRMQDLMDVATNLGVEGLTDKMSGTLETKLSNIGDFFTKFYYKIADAGAFDQLKRMISNMADFLTNDELMNEDRISGLASAINDALTFILTPLEKLTEKFKELSVAVVDFVTKHPALLKIGLVFVTIAGGALTLLGVFAKLGGAATSFLASLKYLNGGVSILASFRTGLWSIIKLFGPLAAAGYLFYKIWEANIGGIQDILKEKFGRIADTFKILWDAITDNTLSEENFKRANELGLLPLIESVLQLKYHWGFFVEGFKKGLDNFVKGIGTILVKLGILDTNFTGFRDLLTKIFEAMTKPGMTSTWEKIGEVVGGLTGKILLLVAGLGLVHKAFSLIGGVASKFGKISKVPVLGKLFGGSKSGGVGGLSDSFLAHPVNTLKSMTSVAIILGGVVLIIEALGLLESIPGFSKYMSSGFDVISKLFQNLIPLISDIVALALAVKLLDVIKLKPTQALKGIADLAIILGGFELITEAIGLLNFSSDTLTSGIDTLTQIFSSLEVFSTLDFWGLLAAVEVLGKLGGVKTTTYGLLALAEILAGIEVIIAAFGALAQIPGYTEFMDGGIEALIQVLGGVGRAIGNLVGGIVEGFTDVLPAIGANLSQFGENISPFFTAIKDVDAGAAGDFLLSFAEAILILTASDLLETLNVFSSLDLAKLGGQLSDFADKASGFFDKVSSYSTDGIDNAVKVMDVLQLMGSANLRTGGMLQAIMGEVDLARIGEQLSSFAPNAKTFFESVATYSDAGIEKAPKVLDAIGGIGNFDFKTGGFAQRLLGETDLARIGEQLSSFSTTARTFFNAVANYPEAGIERAPKVFNAIAGIGDYDFKTDGFFQMITGETGLDKIGQQLAAFAPDGATFFNAVAGYSSTGLELAPKVFEVLAGIGDSAFKIGGIDALINGETNLSKIGSQLVDFAPKVAKYLDTVSGYSLDDISKGTAVMNFLTTIGDCGLKSGGLTNIFSGKIDLEDIGEQLTDYAEELEDFFDIVGWFNESDIANGVACIQMLQTLGETNLKSNYNLDKLGGQLAPFGEGASAFLNSIKDVTYDSINKGSMVIDLFNAFNTKTFKGGGLMQMLSGTVDITNIAKNLGDFGTNSKTFYNSIKDIDESSLTKSKSLFESLSTMGSMSNVLASLGNGRLVAFGKSLVTFIGYVKTFFEREAEIKTTEFNLGESLTPFFDSIDDFKVDKLNTLSSGLEKVSSSARKMGNTFKNVASDITNYTNNIVSAVQNCVHVSVAALNSLVLQGGSVGYNLMASVASGISANAYLISNAVQNAVNSVNVSVPTIASQTANRVYGPQKMVGLATGGYVSTTGIAVLHPNEVVVNDQTTQDLKEFLNNYKSKATVGVTKKYTNVVNNYSALNEVKTVEVLNSILKTLNSRFESVNSTIKNNPLNYGSSTVLNDIIPVLKGLAVSLNDYAKNSYDRSPLVQQDIIATDDFAERPPVVVDVPDRGEPENKPTPQVNSPIQNLVNNTVYNSADTYNDGESSKTANDNRVTFESGSVVFNVTGKEVANLSKEQLNKYADELLQIITRKLQLRGLQTRK